MRTLAVLIALWSFVASAEAPRPIRCDFTSQPDGASVLVDGAMRGVTPLTLYDLAAGRHHVRFTFPNYESADEFVVLQEGSVTQKNAELVPVKGLLLVTTEPAGCDISLDGLSFGETPRLITSLDARETYRFLLQKPGYQPRPMEVKFNGRAPLVRQETLIVDSGAIEVTSEPEGAEVTVNGIIRGTTPLTVTDVPKGRTTVTFRKDGFEEASRELSVTAGESQTLFIRLRGIPGTLALTSVPEGARFYVNDKPEGKGPVTLKDLPPGAYVIRAELDGHATMTRTVNLRNGAAAAEEFRLESVMGRLELRTIPAGVRVLVDGSASGTTKAKGEDTEPSELLTLDNVMRGDHTLTFKRDGYADVVKHVTVEDQKTCSLNVRLKKLFIPDVEIVTDGGKYRGVLVSQGAAGIEIEIKPGVNRMFTQGEIRKLNFLK